MAEQKEENERVVYKSTLEEIVEKMLQKLSKKNPENIVIPKSGKSIGILTFKKNQEIKTKKLYLISMVVDGKDVDYIYDEDGDNIARVRGNNDVYLDDDIQLEQEKLIENMNFYQNDNEGRDIADRTETIVISDEGKQNSDIVNSNKLPNLIDSEVKIDRSIAIIDLYRTIYNGRRLRDMFGIISKLKDRIPAGADINNLIYLSVVDSKELSSRDGKERNSDVTCVIMDDPRNPKYMVELDETILKPRENLSKQENITADKTSERLGDGERKSGATTTTNTRQITTFDIPGAEGEIGQTNDLLTLEIRKNSKYIDESTTQRNDAHNTEIYLGVQDKSKTENEQQHGLNTQSIKLEAYDETKNINEIEQQNDFANYYGESDEHMYSYDRYIENVFKTIAEEKYQVRDAQELNENLKVELNEYIEDLKKQGKNWEAVTSAITTVVENRSRYWNIAHDIANNSNVFGNKDVYTKICKIEKEFKEKNKQLCDLTDDQIKNIVQSQLESERIPGVPSNPGM